MTISGSLEQLNLLHEIVTSNISQIKSGSNVPARTDVKDSGIESEVSTHKSLGSEDGNLKNISRGSSPDILKQIAFGGNKNNYFVPFDLLLTASSISLMTYFNETTLPDWPKIIGRYEVRERRRLRKRHNPVLDDQATSTVNSYPVNMIFVSGHHRSLSSLFFGFI